MAQKQNPNSLRLLKTNKHHKACWYGDYYYSSQLLNNYKICKYIDCIFRKIKRCNADYFLKVQHQSNEIFYMFPKKSKRFSRRHNKSLTIKRENPNFNGQLELGSAFRPDNLFFESQFAAFLKNQRKTFSTEFSGTRFFSLVYVKPALNQQTSLKEESEKGKLLANNLSSQNSKLKIILNKPLQFKACLVNSLVSRAQGVVAKKRFSRFIEKKQRPREIIAGVIDKAQFPEGKKYLDNKLDFSFSRNAVATPPVDHLFSSKILGLDCSLENNFKLKKTLTEKENKKRHRLIELQTSTKTNLYPIKVAFPQQSCEFLAQKVCRALYQRTAFGRVKRQILWDVKGSGYIKGVRVSCAGRVESKSKKAQKARTRTFQWGQTEVQTFSSPVQFISKALNTSFGKIGVKVWICFTKDSVKG